MICARASLSSTSAIRAAMCDWRSLAAAYSAFSFRSPWARASSMSWTFLGRSTDFKCLSSSRSLRCPSGVIGTFCLLIILFSPPLLFLPCHVRNAFLGVRPAREHEKVIRKTVDVDNNLRIDRGSLRLGEGDHVAFRATAHRAGDMAAGRKLGASRQNERLQWIELRFHPVDRRLQRRRVLVGDEGNQLSLKLRRIGRGQNGPDVEQIVLDLFQKRRNLGNHGRRRQAADPTDGRIQFVDRSVRADTRMILPDTAASEETGFSLIAGFCINLHGFRLRLQPFPPPPSFAGYPTSVIES